MSRDDQSGETTEDPPSLGDRVEASEDFRASLEQSVGLVKEHRRLLILLALASLLAFGVLVVYPYLV